MPLTVVIFAWRKQGVSPAEFRDHYDNFHVPMVKSFAGDKFPISHTRHYIQRAPSAAAAGGEAGGEGTVDTTGNAAWPAVALMGEPGDFDYDSFAELVFEDQEKFGEFMGVVMEEGNAKKLAEDEDKFLDRTKMKVAWVDQVSVTSR